MPLLPSPPASFDAEPLLQLLAASKQDVLDGILVDAFRLRHEGLSPLVTHAKTSLLQQQLSGAASAHLLTYSLSSASPPTICFATSQKAKQWQAALSKTQTEVQQVNRALNHTARNGLHGSHTRSLANSLTRVIHCSFTSFCVHSCLCR